MSLVALIHAIGNLSIFPSRAFIPAFLTALFLRFGPDIPIVRESGLLHAIGSVPTWFTCDFTLVVLGILSALEIAATKSSDARDFLHEIDPYLKSAMAFLATVGVLSASDQKVIDEIRSSAPSVSDLGLSAAVAGGVFYITLLRQGVMSVLLHADPDDDLRLQKFVSWMEDLWSAVGLLLLLLFPFFILFVVMLVSVALYAMQRYIQYREEKSKVPCSSCGHMLYPIAPGCPRCKTQVAQPPRAVGFLGMPSSSPALDLKSHALDLIGKKRCPCCAARFPQRSAKQACVDCGHDLMAQRADGDVFVAHIDQRLNKTLGMCMALSVIPVLGLVPGIIYYRIKIVAPFRQYIPFGRGLLVKWSVGLLNLVLILLQPVPILGAFLLPLMAYTNYRVYRGVYVSALDAPVPPAAVARLPLAAAPVTQDPAVSGR